MLTREESLKIIEKYSTREILMAMLKSMDDYHELLFIERIRTSLESHWADNLWWPNTKMVDFVPSLFTVRKTNQSRYSGGGSWSPEGVYYVDVIQCLLCGELIEINYGWKYEKGKADFKNPTHSHMRQCKKVQDCRKQSNSIEEFKYLLDGMKLL